MHMLDLKEKLLKNAPAKIFKAKNLDLAPDLSEKPDNKDSDDNAKKDIGGNKNDGAKNGNKKEEAETPPPEQYFGLIPLGEGAPIPLRFMNNLPIILGRGGLTGIDDNRLSRQHLEVHKTSEKNRVNIKLLGANASKIIRNETGEEFKLTKGKVVPLQVDDTIQFLPGLHGYMLVETGKMEVSEIEEPKTPEHVEPEIELQNNAAKNKRQPTVLQEEDATDKKDKNTVEMSEELNSATKKRKLEEAESEQKAKKMKLENEENNHITTIKGILPDVTERQIKIALNKAANNIEQALEYLLTASHQQEQNEDYAKEKVNGSNNYSNNVNKNQSSEVVSDGSIKNIDQSNEKQPDNVNNNSTKDDGVKEDVLMKDIGNTSKSHPSTNNEDIVKLYEELERYKREKQRAEEDTKAQQEIIKILVKEKEEAERQAGSNKVSLNAEEENKLYLPGEKDALKGNKTKIFSLYPSTRFENDAATIHFRMAESQFYRLMERNTSAKVTKVEYVVNPKLIAKFQKRRLEMAQEVDWEQTKPILCFHGTREENIPNIIENNFSLDRVGSSTDEGFYGAGIYFSELPSISMDYAGGAKFLLCQVIVGQTYKMSGTEVGCKLKYGYHSHSSPCGSEIVIFNMDQILPTYIVHFSGSEAAGSSKVPKMTLIYNNKNGAKGGDDYYGDSYGDSYDEGYDDEDEYGEEYY